MDMPSPRVPLSLQASLILAKQEAVKNSSCCLMKACCRAAV